MYNIYPAAVKLKASAAGEYSQERSNELDEDYSITEDRCSYLNDARLILDEVS